MEGVVEVSVQTPPASAPLSRVFKSIVFPLSLQIFIGILATPALGVAIILMVSVAVPGQVPLLVKVIL